jgi:hypothetical protein
VWTVWTLSHGQADWLNDSGRCKNVKGVRHIWVGNGNRVSACGRGLEEANIAALKDPSQNASVMSHDAVRGFLAFAVVLVLLVGLSAIAAPVNDNFGNAVRVSGFSVLTSGSNVGATQESGEPVHTFGGGKSVWWKWSAPVPHSVMEVNTIGSSFDTVLAVYEPLNWESPTVNYLRVIGRDDESGGNHTSKLLFQAYSTNDHYIAVDGYAGETGNITLRLQPIPPPPNDNFGSASLMTGLTSTVTGHNTNATGEVGEPEHGFNPIPRSVWWRWVAPTNWVVRVDTFGSHQSFSPYVAAYQGSSVSTLTYLAGADRYSWLTFRPQTGQAYYFAVDGWYGDVGRIVLNLQASPPPANDAFTAATLITGYTNSVSGDNTFATQETSEPIHSGSTAGKSLWYRWTAPTNWAVVIDSSGALNAAIAVYRGSSLASLIPVATQSFGQVTFTATANQAYYIAVDSQSASTQSGGFTLNLRTLRPPTNDTFAAGVTVTGTNFLVQGSLLGGRTETFEPSHAGGASVWYRWVAPRTGRVRLSCYQEVTAYFGTSLSGLTTVSRSTPNYSEYVFDAVGGTQYKFAVSGSPGLATPFGLELTYGPANDDFASAVRLTSIVNSVQGSTVGASLEFGEPSQSQSYGASAWWSFTAPANGALEVNVPGLDQWPMLFIFEGSSVSNLVVKASNRVPTSEFVRCTVGCSVTGGQIYYICAFRDEVEFAFEAKFSFSPPNDPFAGRITMDPRTTVAFSSTIGGSRELGEPWVGSNSVWWSWTPRYAGPVIFTTYGSACDTTLGVYAGNVVSALSQIATNDDCLVWTNGHPAAGWAIAGGPTNDVVSRVRFNADNGVPYKIAVSVAPTNQRPGQVAVNITQLAIDDVSIPTRSSNANRTVSFTASLRIVNLQTNNSGSLRVRLFARPGYSYRESNPYNCFGDNFTAGETNLGTFSLPIPGTILAGSTAQISVSGVCPAPYEAPPTANPTSDWGYGFGVIGVLEERQSSGEWVVHDRRMILIGNWPRIGPVNGPGGGVILVSASLQSGNEVGFLDVKVGPPAAVRLGGAWRVSPTNFGELGELRPYTNYTGTDLRLAIRSTNFSIQTRPMTGFQSPPNQSVTIQPSAVVPLNLNYSVNPPLLAFDRQRGFGISGTPGTTYRIQYNTNLPQSTWLNYMSLTLGNGTTWLPQTTNYISNRIYRAFWLSN